MDNNWNNTNVFAIFVDCANSSMGLLEDELDRQKDENRNQHEQIHALQTKIYEMEAKLQKVSILH